MWPEIASKLFNFFVGYVVFILFVAPIICIVFSSLLDIYFKKKIEHLSNIVKMSQQVGEND